MDGIETKHGAIRIRRGGVCVYIRDFNYLI
jgi:hypothetical protein